MIRRWLRVPRVRGSVSLVAVLVLYFAVPVSANARAYPVLMDLLLSGACLAVVTVIVVREVRRLIWGRDRRLSALQLVLLLEVVTVAFALTYDTLAIHGHGQMAGVRTRMDALYFTVTTMATVGFGDVHPTGQLARGVASAQMTFDILFIAAFARLITTGPRETRSGPAALDDD